MKPIKVGVVGAAGRMGRMLAAEALAAPGIALCAVFEREGHPELGRDMGLLLGQGELGVPLGADLGALVAAVDVVIDFSAPVLTARLAPLAAEHGTRLVIGTTGLSAEQRAALHAASEAVATVWAPNMSVGVNVLFRLVGEAARLLGLDYDIEIVEAHHKHKQDAPSGTALRLAEIAAAATPGGGPLVERLKHGRQGVDPHRPHQIGMHAVRAADIVGDHTVVLATEGERVELTHRASSRQTFSRGALRAARWVATQTPGLYDMQDVLGLRG